MGVATKSKISYRELKDNEIIIGLEYYIQDNISLKWKKEVIQGLGDLYLFLKNYLQYPKPRIIIKNS